MKKNIFLFVFLISSSYLFSQSQFEPYVPVKKTQKGFGKINFLPVDLPSIDPDMGFTGVHYNLFLNDWSYAGLGIYGAVGGNKGGFFTLGINGGIKKYLSDKFFIDVGFHFGGGGGASAPDGGGAFILPHANLGYNFKAFSLTTGLSYINFFDKGNIEGYQVNVGIEIPLDYEYADYSTQERVVSLYELKESVWNKKASRSSLMLHLNNLVIGGESKNTSGIKYNGETIRLAGFEFSSYLHKNWFAFFKVDGAYDGIKAGYMDVFLGAGYHLSMNKNNTNILAKFGVGAGGGGGVDTQGGFLIYPDISLEQRIFDNVYLSVNKGLLMSPDSHFYTSSYGLGIKYYMDRNGIIAKGKTFTEGKFKGFEVVVKQDYYIDAERDKKVIEDLHLISLQVNLNINRNIYVAGQTSFANFGNAGAYAEGIVGFGFKTMPLFNKTTTFFTQVLGGAAGGGGVSTGEGLIIKPSLGVNYQLTNHLNLRTAVGYVKTSGAGLGSTFANLGVSYNLAFLKMN